jgi:hypothetical protein
MSSAPLCAAMGAPPDQQQQDVAAQSVQEGEDRAVARAGLISIAAT